jgi:hypothetical protein
MHGGNRSDAFSYRSVDEQFAGLQRNLGPTNCLARPAEVHRIAGEIALKSPAPDTQKAEKYFERALSVPRRRQTKSWELRAAMMA